MLLIIAALAACRGEPVPRDYQNAPPAMTHPAQSKDETPTQHGMGQATPEPTSGEGTAAPTEPISPPVTTTTMGDTPPVTTTTTGTTATTKT
jgi:hypothetical protein